MVETIVGPQAAGAALPSFLPIYWDTLPPGLVDLRTAAEEYGRARNTINKWVAIGKLPVVGVLFHSHGLSKVLRVEDLVALVEGGSPENRIPRFCKIPEGMITLDTATDKYDLSLNTLRCWVNMGQIPLAGKLKEPGNPSLFSLIIEENLVETLVQKGKIARI